MDSSLKRELSYCISELDAIARELYAVSDDIRGCISGMNTKRYTNALDSSASKYKKAANNLRRIK